MSGHRAPLPTSSVGSIAARLPTHRALRRAVASLGVAAAAILAALPVQAANWAFASDSPLLLGGFVSGSFSGVDTNADQAIGIGELTSFNVSYAGSSPTTASFSIGKPPFGADDRFLFDLAGGVFDFAVFDSLGRSISGGNQGFTSVVGLADTDAGGFLNVSAVPEPASAALLFGGLLLVGTAATRRRR